MVLRTRQAALQGADDQADSFTLDVLGRRGGRRRETVSTSLLPDAAGGLADVPSPVASPAAVAQASDVITVRHR
ncbi:hypothetical protein ACWIG3_16510 [Streptomyces celluloflavus]|uniref:hypothetical protein n=1 Tax=Streptomyces celluloflavus TaxID=58344 RepID=UPI0036C7A11A